MRKLLFKSLFNGLENTSKWWYWDGKIIEAPDGKYHLFASIKIQAGDKVFNNKIAVSR